MLTITRKAGRLRPSRFSENNAQGRQLIETAIKWYALQVRSCCEALVEDTLARNGLEAYFPARMVPRRQFHREQMIRRPFFPGYVFTRMDWQQSAFRPVVQVPQVVRVLSIGSQPLAIPDAEMQAVRLMAESPVSASICPFLSDGDRVRVERGPLAGVEGFVVYHRNALRVVVSVSLLQRSICAEVDKAVLEVLPALKAA